MANWVTRIFSQSPNQPDEHIPTAREIELERRAAQIKEILHLGNALRAEVQIDAIARQIIDSISTCIGFRVAFLGLVRDETQDMEWTAFLGVSHDEQRRLRISPIPLTSVFSLMRPEFHTSRSYFIPHEQAHLLKGGEMSIPLAPWQGGGNWHPDDTLLVPLLSPRENKMLGFLWLDDPEDGRHPTGETIEMVELFASQAASGIDNARIIEQRDKERRAIEVAIFDLLEEVEQARKGNLTARTLIGETSLGTLADSMNEMLRSLNNVVVEVRYTTELANQSAAELEKLGRQLIAGAQRQERQASDIASTTQDIAFSVKQVSLNAETASEVAQEALRITGEGREAVEQAVHGMHTVRDMVLQSSRKIKRLGESSQETGEIVQMISDFAAKTNLLALNASIEAVRAGEHGRGFSGIAQEIRNLANNSAEAARQVAARIKSIQNETNAVVVSMEQSTQQVVLQSDQIAHAGSALQAMDAITERIAQHIAGISAAAEQQATASGFVAHAINDLSRIALSITQLVSKMQTSTVRLNELSESVQQRLNGFRLTEPEQPRPESLLNRSSRPISTPRPNVSQDGVRQVTIQEEKASHE